MKFLRKFQNFLLEIFYRIYRLVKPFGDALLRSFFGFVPHCKHQPSCSVYAVRMMKLHGTMRGGLLGLRQILLCWGV